MAKTACIVTRPDISRMARDICTVYGLPKKVNNLAPGAVVDANPGGLKGSCRGWVCLPWPYYVKQTNDGSDTDEWGFLITQELQDMWAQGKHLLKDQAERDWVTAHLADTADIDVAAWKDADGNYVTGTVDLVSLV